MATCTHGHGYNYFGDSCFKREKVPREYFQLTQVETHSELQPPQHHEIMVGRKSVGSTGGTHDNVMDYSVRQLNLFRPLINIQCTTRLDTCELLS